ncbi:NADP-dependent oxidoreductase [Dactylosporangium matsuzakiense]|uniref:Oxidoreductase n=1 Tax=Dactylosporangium matsuzakiense TaxID=53360 RepID=A0A9W6NSF5_9ACTN|nr:NADP-dependent oxidoreductase [Dactylosporangium matsuzakiense]UWZ40909.1 NADP-dependent oxidoreductase [Dactylosporangium matsuzakiense]GLL08305.1 oxidoreductase [Dactylosporangium matsuzakiense]
MRTLRFHDYGDPATVLRLETAEPPQPGPGQVRVAVQACGLNAADWALCRGLFPGTLPRGVGLEVAGTVDALGADVTGASIGDAVFGPAPFTGPTAGASEFAVLDTWFPRPAGLDPVAAAALPMAVETAYRGLDALGVGAGTTVLVSGGGTMVGYAAVQIAAHLGARVIATAGSTFAGALQAAGAQVTPYGPGVAERVTALAGGLVDVALDAAPPSGVLPELVRTVAAPGHVLTLSDMAAAGPLGVRTGIGDAGMRLCHFAIPEYAALAAAGRFTIPVAAVHELDDWRTALATSLSGHARGKLVLRIGR